MKSKIFAWIAGGAFTLLVFAGGFLSAFSINYLSLANTYTKEHIDNGRFMLWALKYLENGETDKAKELLRGQVSAKVSIVGAVRLPPTSQREIELIESFYLEVIEYFESRGGYNETFKVKENGTWTIKPAHSMVILEEFKKEHNKIKIQD